MSLVAGCQNPEALALAQLFSTCVECFGLIHPGKEWNHEQKVTLAKLGIQQGRLLAWGDMVGLLDVTPARDPRLDDPEIRPTIEQALNEIIDRPAHVDRETLFEQYGLKPPRRFTQASQPALDTARIESFRERLELLQNQRWEIRRGMSITINHWIITDLGRFNAFLALIKEKVDYLIGLMGVETKVDTAIKCDIKALGWHPVFDKLRASSDTAKLRLIAEACKHDYPGYVQVTAGALTYLDKEWRENYQETILGQPQGSEIPGAAAHVYAQSLKAKSSHEKKPKKKKSAASRPDFLKIFHPKSWRRSIPDASAARSQSVPTGNTGLQTPPLSPQEERSKSISVPHGENPNLSPVGPGDGDATLGAEGSIPGDSMSRVETYKTLVSLRDMQPVASAVSRHDYWRSPW